jgi:hypothetical protein
MRLGATVKAKAFYGTMFPSQTPTFAIRRPGDPANTCVACLRVPQGRLHDQVKFRRACARVSVLAFLVTVLNFFAALWCLGSCARPAPRMPLGPVIAHGPKMAPKRAWDAPR